MMLNPLMRARCSLERACVFTISPNKPRWAGRRHPLGGRRLRPRETEQPEPGSVQLDCVTALPTLQPCPSHDTALPLQTQPESTAYEYLFQQPSVLPGAFSNGRFWPRSLLP